MRMKESTIAFYKVQWKFVCRDFSENATVGIRGLGRRDFVILLACNQKNSVGRIAWVIVLQIIESQGHGKNRAAVSSTRLGRTRR